MSSAVRLGRVALCAGARSIVNALAALALEVPFLFESRERMASKSSRSTPGRGVTTLSTDADKNSLSSANNTAQTQEVSHIRGHGH